MSLQLPSDRIASTSSTSTIITLKTLSTMVIVNILELACERTQPISMFKMHLDEKRQIKLDPFWNALRS